jgi:chorismate mutase
MELEMAKFDCESIKEMLEESPVVAGVVIEMIKDLDELDEECAELLRERMRTARPPLLM